jgi:hypothetical protein
MAKSSNSVLSNSVIKNSSGPTKFVRSGVSYNWVVLCSRMVVWDWMDILFIITEFHCTVLLDALISIN